MKKVFFILLFISTITCAQTSGIKKAVYSKKNKDGNYEFYAENKDAFNKVVFINFKKLTNSSFGNNRIYSKTIKPGKNVLFVLEKSDEDKPMSFSYHYELKKGCKKVEINNDIKYLLPVSPYKKTRVKFRTYKNLKNSEEDSPKDFNLMSFNMHEGDTVFASRSGLISLDEVKHIDMYGNILENELFSISIMHKDCSFSTYSFMKSLLINLGEFVIAGHPIGIAKGSISFKLYYLEPTAEKDKETNKIYYDNNLRYVPVHFDLAKGETKLDSTKSYQPIHRFETITQEMSKREVKKYKKQIYSSH